MKKLFFFFLLPFLFSQTSQEIDGVAAIVEDVSKKEVEKNYEY